MPRLDHTVLVGLGPAESFALVADALTGSDAPAPGTPLPGLGRLGRLGRLDAEVTAAVAGRSLTLSVAAIGGRPPAHPAAATLLFEPRDGGTRVSVHAWYRPTGLAAWLDRLTTRPKVARLLAGLVDPLASRFPAAKTCASGTCTGCGSGGCG